MARDTGSLLSFRPSIKVMDATMRDGGLVNNFRFSDEWVRALVSANIRAGVDYMELGYKSDPDLFDENKFGKWKFCRDEDVFNVLGGAPEGLKLACMADVGRCNYERDIGPRENSPFSMYRIATYINTIPAALAMVEHCHKMGYETAVNIMAISKATEKELSLALDLIGNPPQTSSISSTATALSTPKRCASSQSAISKRAKSTGKTSASTRTTIRNSPLRTPSNARHWASTISTRPYRAWEGGRATAAWSCFWDS